MLNLLQVLPVNLMCTADCYSPHPSDEQHLLNSNHLLNEADPPGPGQQGRDFPGSDTPPAGFTFRSSSQRANCRPGSPTHHLERRSERSPDVSPAAQVCFQTEGRCLVAFV